MSQDGSPPASPAASGGGRLPLLDQKAALKDSLVEVLRENPSLLREAPDSATRSGELSLVSFNFVCTVVGLCVVVGCWSSSTGKLRG